MTFTRYSPIRMRFMIPIMYPRRRGYRFSFMKRRTRLVDTKFWNHPLLNQRPKPSSNSRKTYIQYNAEARKHNRGN